MQQLGGEETAIRRPNITLVGKPSFPLIKMPLEYTTFDPIGAIQSVITATRKSFDLTQSFDSVPLALNKEQQWLELTMAAVNKESDLVPDNARWSTYHIPQRHCGTNNYRARFNGEDGACISCSEDETVEHMLLDCEVYWEKRENIYNFSRERFSPASLFSILGGLSKLNNNLEKVRI
ncbi:hypothetical protein QYM36_009898, partial [Artemia franciscana]